ncbi:MAG: hypothetical protein Q7W30_08145 [Coriobacteriia bacterium]|nr:hypothetical protein [Coriobacteriia bacterium]
MNRLWPQVGRRWLYAIAAVFWAIAGAILIGWTTVWLLQAPVIEELALAHLGAVAALFAGRFMFMGVVRANIRRIEAGPDHAWAPAFQNWRSYLIMVFMMALGVVLRLSPIPRVVLAVVYEAIGGGLLLGSFVYLRRFLNKDAHILSRGGE